MSKPTILYVFGGEKAQGAEIVIERLMLYNAEHVNTILVMAPGAFADDLLGASKPYQMVLLNDLKKLNRSSTGAVKYIIQAIRNYFSISYKVYKIIKKK